jgi:hypothetical protein
MVDSTLKPRWQFLPPMSGPDYARLKDGIGASGFLPGQEVVIDHQGRILDGHHRARACAELGLDVPTRVVDRDLTDDEAWEYIWLVNVNRRHLTIEQKRDLIRERLRRRPDESDRSIAQQVGVHHETVGVQRAELEASGEIRQTVRPHQRTDQGRAAAVADSEQYGVDPDDDDPEGDERGVMEDVADHRRMTWVEVTINYAAPSDVERARMNARLGAHLPYPRDSERREWPSKRFYLTTAPPKSASEVEPMLVEIHQQLRSRILERPLRTMMRDA